MVFSSLVFLGFYLTITLLIYYCVPRKFRNLWLFVVSLIFYGWGEPLYVLLMLFSTVVDYSHGWFIAKYRLTKPKLAKGLVVSSAVINLALLGFFKYAGFISNTLKVVVPFLNIPVIEVALPIGISFYTFQTMSYSIDIYRGDAEAQKNPISFGAYVVLFPQLIAGPIVRYKDVAEQLQHRREKLELFSNGVRLFVMGLAKKVLIANQMGALWDILRATSETNGVLGSWIGIIAFSFQIYFDFSGYSDMARGLGNMMGFEFLKNFDYPYISKSITEFWRRWHISLGTWFREYVYIPLGGNRRGTGRTLFNILVVWFLTGLWHGASWNFILWGMYFAVFLLIEKLFLYKLLEKLPKFISHIYALIVVVIGWVIFFYEDGQGGLSAGFEFFKTLFSGSLISGQALTSVISYLPLIIFAVIASTPILKKIYLYFKGKGWGFTVVESIGTFAVLALCVASLVNQSYNPFLYFRF
ncbi:MAG: MBOAT family protein [Clostridia bacterium]|nr:MBOAT family protein [Clostridia bacterium]